MDATKVQQWLDQHNAKLKIVYQAGWWVEIKSGSIQVQTDPADSRIRLSEMIAQLMLDFEKVSKLLIEEDTLP